MGSGKGVLLKTKVLNQTPPPPPRNIQTHTLKQTKHLTNPKPNTTPKAPQFK